MSPICRSMTSWSRLLIPRGRFPFDLSLYLVANRPSFQDETLFFSKIMSAVNVGGVIALALQKTQVQFLEQI